MDAPAIPKLEPVEAKPVKSTPVAVAPEPMRVPERPADAVAVAVVPDVTLLLKRSEERVAFLRAFCEEGLTVDAPDAPDLATLTDDGLAKLVVVDDRERFAELLGKPVDVILVTDEDVEDGPVGDHAYVAHRPLDLANPLGK